MRRLEGELDRLKAEHGYRSLRTAQGRDFSSNDYLGFATHPALIAAAHEGLDASGAVGAAGSRLLRGHHRLHQELEAAAAQFFGSEAALYFGSGYLANLALFSTLCARRDAIVFDERIHASMKEGIHAAPAERYRARHNDPADVEANLRRAREKGAQELWLAVESVYSMDGDLAPIDDLQMLARRYDATLIVDEAHGTGVFGANGRGLCEGLESSRLITVHTCGKALGVAGALVCAPRLVVEYLINKARPFIYSTAPPPFLAAALTRALRLIDEEPWRRQTLHGRIGTAADALVKSTGVATAFAGSQVLPVILGNAARAMAVAEGLQARGFDVRAIRPPTVPDGTSRLRISIHATHSEAEIVALADAVAACMAEATAGAA
jgi:8-amino-7-oxononanoate synthase